MRKGIIFGSIAAAGLVGPALAQDGFSYSYIEAGYINSEFDDLDIDGDGFGIRGSWGVAENVHLFASYEDLGFDFDVDAQGFELGAGVNWPVSPRLDLVGTLSYLDREFDIPGFGTLDDSGYGLGLGLRGAVGEQLELTGGLKYIDLDDSGDDTSFGVGGRFYFTQSLAGNLDASFNDDGTTWMLGVRYDFMR